MSGAVVLGDFRIIGGSLRGIIDEQGNRSSRCFSVENAGEDLNLVSLLSLSDIFLTDTRESVILIFIYAW